MSFLNKFGAFLVRDLKISFTYKFNLLIQLVGLIFLFTVAFFSLKEDIQDQINLSYIYFFLNLASIDFMLSAISVFSREVRTAQIAGTFEAMLLTNTSFFTLIFSSYARTLVRCITRTIVYFIICKLFFYAEIGFFEMLILIASLIYNSIPFIAIGLISVSFIVAFKVGNIANFFISLLAIFFSGIFFPISSLPEFFQFLGNMNPLKVGLETTKILIQDNFVFLDLLPYLTVTLIEIILFLPIGIILLHYGFRLAKKNGNLSFY